MACGGIGEWFGLLKISISSLCSATLNKATIEVKMIYLEYKSPNSPHIPTSLQSYALLYRNSGTAMEHVHTEENRQKKRSWELCLHTHPSILTKPPWHKDNYLFAELRNKTTKIISHSLVFPAPIQMATTAC